MINISKYNCPKCGYHFGTAVSQGTSKNFGPLAVRCPICQNPISLDKYLYEFELLREGKKIEFTICEYIRTALIALMCAFLVLGLVFMADLGINPYIIVSICCITALIPAFFISKYRMIEVKNNSQERISDPEYMEMCKYFGFLSDKKNGRDVFKLKYEE